MLMQNKTAIITSSDDKFLKDSDEKLRIGSRSTSADSLSLIMSYEHKTYFGTESKDQHKHRSLQRG
jgi:hypothetical protein